MALPMEVSLLAETYYRLQAEHAAQSSQAAHALWQSIPLDMSLAEGWPEIAGPLLDIVTERQVGSATLANAYIQAQADAQNVDLDTIIDPAQFATPTENSEYWTSYAVTRSLQAANGTGLPEVAARALGAFNLISTVGTMVLDAGREATQANITASPTMVGYYRKLRTPSCSRCAVLAGAFYRWNEGFARHPRCDCEHVPAAEMDDSMAFDSYTAIEAGQITGLNKADTDAILNGGADVNQIINAKRGMRTVDIHGERIQTTTEGTTRRGVAGSRLRVGYHRLTPREIYRQAGTDRDLARRLLYRHGYVL